MMPLFPFFFKDKKNSANTAKGRLQLILAHDRSDGKFAANFLPQLQKELVSVILKYVQIDPNDIKVNLEKQGTLELLEVKIEIPQTQR